jgi:ubiquinone/menaquinone biosynthesis C-methylase UbiE
MLVEAQKKVAQRVGFAQACGESLPISDASVDLVFMSMVFHHFQDVDRAVQECRRVLRQGGAVCLRAGSAYQIETYPYVPFFARSRELLGKVLQSGSVIDQFSTRVDLNTFIMK